MFTPGAAQEQCLGDGSMISPSFGHWLIFHCSKKHQFSWYVNDTEWLRRWELLKIWSVMSAIPYHIESSLPPPEFRWAPLGLKEDYQTNQPEYHILLGIIWIPGVTPRIFTTKVKMPAYELLPDKAKPSRIMTLIKSDATKR